MSFESKIEEAWTRIRKTSKDPEERANLIILEAVTLIGITGAAPLVSWAALAAGNVAAITILAVNYNLDKQWDAARSREMLTQILRAASLSTMMLLGGGKIIADLFKVTGVATVPGMIADGLLNAAVTYTILSSARDVFRKGGEIGRDELTALVKAKLREAPSRVKEMQAKRNLASS